MKLYKNVIHKYDRQGAVLAHSLMNLVICRHKCFFFLSSVDKTDDFCQVSNLV